MTVSEYAIDLVATGADLVATGDEHVAEDDMNESEDIAGDQHREACDLALSMATTIRNNPAAFLAWFEAIRNMNEEQGA